ncbi:MAG: hypothetical protein IPJ59_18570 [Nannocystis sp.]|nr:hypothetical protein [Nannocystis sp.]
MSPEEREAYARSMFKEHPELFPEVHRSPILNGVIVAGMTPFESKLAGGAFAFKVIADTSRWPAHSDPLRVMWQQSIAPDSSQIWMTFKNDTQFPNEPGTLFRVEFHDGKVARIDRLPSPQDP